MSESIHQREFKGHHLAIIMVCFFGVIITVNFTMAYLAKSKWTGLVVKNSYVASQEFNDVAKAAQVQKTLGWLSAVSFADGRLDVAIFDKGKRPVRLDALRVLIGRPAFEQQDFEMDLTLGRSGIFSDLVDLKKGVWSITLNGRSGELTYRRDLRLYVDGAGRGHVE